MIRSINPSTGQLIDEYTPYSDMQVLSIVEDVSNAYISWKNVSFKERAKVLYDIADELDSNLENHARMISLEIGKPIVESRMEIEKCIWVLEYFAENAKDFLKNEIIKTEYKESYIQYDPIGVILGVMPWNFPYW